MRALLAVTLSVAGSLPEWKSPYAVCSPESCWIPAHPGLGIEPAMYPVAAADFIERHGIRGRSYNHFELGGYLLWRFHPQRDRLPFTDVHLTGSPEDRQLIGAAMIEPAAWTALDRHHRFDWVLLWRRPDVDHTADYLDADSAFALVFMDDIAALYVRRTGPMRKVAARSGYRILRGGWDSAAAIAAAFEDPARAAQLEAELTRVAAESPFHGIPLSVRANRLYRAGRLAEARDALRGALAIDRRYPLANRRLAEVALALDRPVEALSAGKRAQSFGETSESLDRLLADARVRQHELEARRSELRPSSTAPRDSLAAIERALAPEPPIARVAVPTGWRTPQ